MSFLPRKIARGATDPAGVTEEPLPGPKPQGLRQGRFRSLHHDRGSLTEVAGMEPKSLCCPELHLLKSATRTATPPATGSNKGCRTPGAALIPRGRKHAIDHRYARIKGRAGSGRDHPPPSRRGTRTPWNDPHRSRRRVPTAKHAD